MLISSFFGGREGDERRGKRRVTCDSLPGGRHGPRNYVTLRLGLGLLLHPRFAFLDLACRLGLHDGPDKSTGACLSVEAIFFFQRGLPRAGPFLPQELALQSWVRVEQPA